jgi:hypothetical protein
MRLSRRLPIAKSWHPPARPPPPPLLPLLLALALLWAQVPLLLPPRRQVSAPGWA